MSDYKKSDRTDWACKTHRLSAEASVNPARYAADMHPYRCSKHPTLQKEYFLVADDPNYLEEGVQLVQFNWDGQISDNTEDQLLLIGQNSSTQIQRAEVPDNAFRDTVGLLCLIAHGYQKWAAEHKQFAVYTPKYSDGDIHSATAIDHRWEKRGQGEARVALGGSMTPSEIEKGGGFWPALVRRHIAYCRRLRFVPNFVRQHFIWCGDEKPSPESTVEIIKLGWDGVLQSSQALIDGYERKISLQEAVASEAHKTLTDIVEGVKGWNGVSLEQTPGKLRVSQQ